MSAILSMVRNGYHRQPNGNFVKTMAFPRPQSSGSGINHYVEQVVRNPQGRIIKVKHQNQRKEHACN